MHCVNCVEKKLYNCSECDLAYCDTCTKEHMYELKDKKVCNSCWDDVKQLEDRSYKILIEGIEGISPDEYDSSAIECYYDKLYNTISQIRKLLIKKRKNSS